jgi:Rrf2 family protein
MLSQAVGNAACALGRIAAAGGRPVLAKDVARDCEIPAPYLAKIINALARKGIVSTQRGVGGGTTLARSPGETSLFDLCVALDDPIVTPRCMLGVAACSDERACPAHQFWTAHRQRQVEFLQRTTVADISAFEANRRWHARPEGDAGPVRAVLGVPAAPPSNPNTP